MAQDKRTFMGGMNKDADVRLIKNPDYTDASNIRVVSSTDGTVGSVENIEGNTEVPFDFYSIDQEILFVNDNGLYEQINPSTVFYQKVIRIEGWEQLNVNYNFTLYSVTPNGNIPIGEFNWVGNNGHTFTAQYLHSQFSTVGGYNTGINVYDVNTGSQYTASVKLLSFGQNSSLNGGYLDIVIECDISGVNFNLAVDSNVNSDQYTYSYSEDSSIPISSSENVSISLLPSFETGGSYNTDATDQGFVISPDGAPYQVDNRTVWTIKFDGMEPTSPESFDPVIIYSYRDNLNPGQTDPTQDVWEFEPLLTIEQSVFSSGTYEFDSNQNNLSEFLHAEFSESKSILCDGLPLNFALSPDNFFLAFSDAATFDNTFQFKVVVVGPVGVRFKLALGDSSESLNAAFSAGDAYIGNNALDSAAIFGNGSIVNLQPYQMIENSIAITSSIVNTFNQIQDELNNAILLQADLSSQNVALNTTNNNLETELEYQTGLAVIAQANLDQTTDDLNTANALNDELNNANSELSDINSNQVNILLNNASIISDLEYDLDNADSIISELQDNLDVEETEVNTLSLQIIHLTDLNNTLQSSYTSFINELNSTYADEFETLGISLTGFDSVIAAIEALIESAVNIVSQQASIEYNNLLIESLQAVGNLQDLHAQELQDAIDAGDADLDDLQLQHNALMAETIAGYTSQLEAFGNTTTSNTIQVANLQNNLIEANNTISELQDQLEGLQISDLIVTSALDQYNDTYTSISTLYNESLTIYNALNVDNAVVYEEDFSSSSDFSGEWVLYGLDYENFQYPPEPITTISNGNYSNPSGYENNGYLKLYTAEENTAAARLPYNSFQSADGWQHGTEVTITIDFEMVNVATGQGSQGASIQGGYEVQITNEWAADGEFQGDFSDAIFSDDYLVTLVGPGNNASLNPVSYSKVFTVSNDGSDDFLDRLCNITIICPPVNDINNELRITNIRLGNTAQEQFSFELNNEVPVAEENYLHFYNMAETVVLDWENSGQDSLQEYLDSMPFGLSYNNLLNITISGYNEFINPNSNNTVGRSLQVYTDAVVAFCSSVQSQIYTQYQLYSTAAGTGTGDLEAMIEEHLTQMQALENQLDYASAEVDQLNDQLDYAQENSGAFLTGPNIAASLVTIFGQDTSTAAAASFGLNQYEVTGDDYEYEIIYKLDGQNTSVATFVILSNEEILSLANEPYSDTNNVVYYLTNRFTNGQAIEYSLPSSYAAPTQSINVLFTNFNAQTSPLDGECPFINVIAGIDINFGPWNTLDIDSVEDLYNFRALQLVFYFDAGLPHNITFGPNDRFNMVRPAGDQMVFMWGYDFKALSFPSSKYSDLA